MAHPHDKTSSFHRASVWVENFVVHFLLLSVKQPIQVARVLLIDVRDLNGCLTESEKGPYKTDKVFYPAHLWRLVGRSGRTTKHKTGQKASKKGVKSGYQRSVSYLVFIVLWFKLPVKLC